MISHIVLTRAPLARALATLEEPWRSLAAVPAASDGTAGACLDFYGMVRGREPETAGGSESPIVALEYEAHEEMARHQMEKILLRLAEKYPLQAALVIHRLGRVNVGEASLLVRLTSPHREEALRACAEFVDELKKWVPIWKQAVRG